jgi:hypothetical protein
VSERVRVGVRWPDEGDWNRVGEYGAAAPEVGTVCAVGGGCECLSEREREGGSE